MATLEAHETAVSSMEAGDENGEDSSEGQASRSLGLQGTTNIKF